MKMTPAQINCRFFLENEIYIKNISLAQAVAYIARDLDEKPVKKKKPVQPVMICSTVSQFG